MNEPSEFQAMDGRKVPLKMSVDYISFSAHVDFTQNSQFIDDVKAPHVVSISIYIILPISILYLQYIDPRSR